MGVIVQREVFGDTFDLNTADATSLAPDAAIPGGFTWHQTFAQPWLCCSHALPCSIVAKALLVDDI